MSPHRTDSSRIKAMAALYEQGFILKEIGAEYGVSAERVRQLLKKHTTVRPSDGGGALRAKRNREAAASARDQQKMAKLGCGWEDYCRIRELGRDLMKSGVSRGRTPMGAFILQRRNAASRGIGWELNFWQWWEIWQASGHWDKRGRGQGYVMCRRGDVGPYAACNVFIAPSIENLSKRKGRKTNLPTGVRAKKGKFDAIRQINGERFYLGSFETPLQAHAAYLAAAPQ